MAPPKVIVEIFEGTSQTAELHILDPDVALTAAGVLGNRVSEASRRYVAPAAARIAAQLNPMRERLETAAARMLQGEDVCYTFGPNSLLSLHDPIELDRLRITLVQGLRNAGLLRYSGELEINEVDVDVFNRRQALRTTAAPTMNDVFDSGVVIRTCGHPDRSQVNHQTLSA